MKAAGVSKDVQPVKAALEVRLGKMEDQLGKANARTERSEDGTGKTEVEAAWVEVLQINLHQCRVACLTGDCRRSKRRYV